MKDYYSPQISNCNPNLSYFYKNSPCSGIYLASTLNSITHSRKTQGSSSCSSHTVIEGQRQEIVYRERQDTTASIIHTHTALSITLLLKNQFLIQLFKYPKASLKYRNNDHNFNCQWKKHSRINDKHAIQSFHEVQDYQLLSGMSYSFDI